MTSTPGNWEHALLALRADPLLQAPACNGLCDGPLIEAAKLHWQGTKRSSISSLIPREGIALDVGAGRGIANFAFAKSGFHAIALEP